MKKIVAVLFFVGAQLLAGCANNPAPGVQYSDVPITPDHNTNPRVGWVQLFNESTNDSVIYKRCDGTTLIYRRYSYQSGIAAVPYSPECTK